MLGAWIQRGGAGEKGPTVYQILMRGELDASGAIQLPPAEHARLREGAVLPGGLHGRQPARKKPARSCPARWARSSIESCSERSSSPAWWCSR